MSHFNKKTFKETFKTGTDYICRLAYASEVQICDIFDADAAVRVVTDAATVYMPMKELVDIDGEIARLNKDLQKATVDKEFFEKKLNNQGFVAKAPAAVVEQQRESLAKVLDKIKMIEENIAEIKALG